MAKKRKVSAFNLTISGLKDRVPYSKVLETLQSRASGGPKQEWVITVGTKSHYFLECEIEGKELFGRFISYRVGDRPDIIDVDEFRLYESELGPSETLVASTYFFVKQKGDKCVLLLEVSKNGIGLRAVERYLQWMVDKVSEGNLIFEDVTISLEALVSEEFLKRLEQLERIKSLKVRMVRPNPGWSDLENYLAKKADRLSAQKAEVIFTPVEGKGLRTPDGIVKEVKELLSDGAFKYVAVSGERNGVDDKFSTEKLGRYEYISFATDDKGKLVIGDVKKKLKKMIEDIL